MNYKKFYWFLISLISVSTALAATPTAPASVNPNICPNGYQCCPDMSNTMRVDATQWQTTGQPLPNNVLNMVWWTSTISNLPNPKGYITCYYNANDPHPYTLESVAPAVKPLKGAQKWQIGKIKDMECYSNQIGDCPFLPDKY